MARRTRFIFILLAVVVAAAVLFQILWSGRATGPVWEGRHLSEWVEILGSRSRTSQNALQSEAEKAVLELGTNCFPYLLSWIQSEHIPWWYSLPARAAHFIYHDQTLNGIFRTRTERLTDGSHTAFSLLRTNVPPGVIAELTRLMNANNALQTAVHAASFLSSTGAKGVPSLVPVLQSASHPLRPVVVRLLLVTPDPSSVNQAAVRALIQCLNDPASQTDVIAASVLGRIKAAPEVTVPALVKCLAGTNAELREAAATALGSFSENAGLSQAALTALLSDPDPGVRHSATNALRNIAPAPGANAASP